MNLYWKNTFMVSMLNKNTTAGHAGKSNEKSAKKHMTKVSAFRNNFGATKLRSSRGET
jgi:hypothetical protein